MKKAPKVTNEERSEIQILHNKGYSARSIAVALGRSPNTVASELKRNAYEDGRYEAKRAKQKAYVRRKYAKYQGKKITENDQLQRFIVSQLEQHWNPDEIAGHLKDNPSFGLCVSKTAIYEWLYSAWGQRYCQYLYSKRYHPKKRRPQAKRTMIPDRLPISQRPESVEQRTGPGDWEYDSIVSSKRSASADALAVTSERVSRLVDAVLVEDLRPEPYAHAITAQLAGKRVTSLTTDNGIENKRHQVITQRTGAPVFFTDPYSSWQKGGVENANKMLRRYFPKGTDFATVSQTEVDAALRLINNKPRKILGYKSSLQVALEKGVIQSGVS